MLEQAIALSVAGRNAEAVLMINQLVAQGEPEAMFVLAEMKWRGGMVPQDPVAARALYARAAVAGHEGAGVATTNLLASGVAGSRDWPAALKRLAAEARRHPSRRAAFTLIEKMKLTQAGDPVAMPAAERLSEGPHVRLFPGLFSAAECDYLRRMAEPVYGPSIVNDAAGRPVRDSIRTSDGATIHWLIEDPAVHALNRRLAGASGTDAAQGEAVQILRYKPGQQYRPHFDFVRASANQRVMTFLVWLNDDYRGGETHFVKTGLQAKGRRGDALLFRNADAQRELDPLSEHEGLPVTSGAKYLASRWIRETRWAP